MGIEDRADRWLSSDTVAAAVLIVGLGFLYRLATAAVTVVTPEETQLLSEGSPSLYGLVLGVLRPVAGVDLLVRMPSILAGTASLWFAFLWIRSAVDRQAALVVLTLLALAPASVKISVQAGPGALLLAELSAALWLLTAAVDRGSRRAGVVSGLLLLAAAATDVSSLFVILGIAACAALRLVRDRRLLRPLGPWMVLTSIALIGVSLAWLTGLVPATPSPASRMAVSERGVVVLGVARLFDAFRFCFSSDAGAIVGVTACLSAIGAMLARSASDRQDPTRLPGLALLVLVPLLAVLGAATAGLVRLDRTSDAAFLSLLCLAAVGWLVAAVFGSRRPTRVLAGLLGLMLVAAATEPGSSSLLKGFSRVTFNHGLDAVRGIVAPGGLVYTSRADRPALERYLLPPGETPRPVESDSFAVCACAGYTLASPKSDAHLALEHLATDLRRLEREIGLERGDRIAVVDLDGQLARELALYEATDLRRSGPAFAVLPAAATGDVLGVLARSAAGRLETPVRTALWPSAFMDDSVITLTRQFAGDVISYEQLYDMIRRDGARMLYDRLPAVCFWLFGDFSERHLNLTRPMDERRSTTSEGYAFDLVLADPDSIAGLFVVTSPAGDALLSLADYARTHLQERFVSVLAPDEFLGNRVRRLLSGLGDNVLMYPDVYLGMRAGSTTRFDDYLPALAFWEFGNKQYHPGFVKRMDGAEDYRTEGYEFTLVAVDSDSLIGLYTIESAEGRALPR